MLVTATFFLLAHLLSPITVTRKGLTAAAVTLLLVPIALTVAAATADCWWSQLRGGSSTTQEPYEPQCAPRSKLRRALRHCFAYVIATVVLIVAVLWIIRATNVVHLDDVHPLLSCDMQNILLQRSQPLTLWIIPIQEGRGISEFPEWCAEMKALEESGRVRLGMHGVRHLIEPSYEFECTAKHCFGNLTAAYREGVEEWERAFGYTPRLFAAPGGFASADAVDVARSDAFRFRLRTLVDGLFQRIYHCDDEFCSTPGGFMCTSEALSVF